MGYRVLDHTADIGIEMEAAGLGGLFAEAARGFADVVSDVGEIGASERRELGLKAEGLDNLLVDWLSELLFIFETEGLLFSEIQVEVVGDGGEWRLAADLRGEVFDGARHPLKVPIKAVTYHQLTIDRQDDGTWAARVIFDI